MCWKRCCPSSPSSTWSTRCFCASVVSSLLTAARRPGARAPRRRPPRTRSRRPRRARSRRARRRRACRGEPRAAPGSWGGRAAPRAGRWRASRRSPLEDALVDQHAQQLLREERVALGRRDDAVEDSGSRRRRRAAPRPSTGWRRRRGARARSASPGRRAPVRALVEERGPRRADDQHGGARRSPRTSCSMSSSSVGSAQWMSSTTSATGRSAASVLEEPPHRPAELLDGKRLRAAARSSRRGDPSRPRPPRR